MQRLRKKRGQWGLFFALFLHNSLRKKYINN